MDGVSLIAARARAYVRERCTKNVDVKRKKKEWGKKKEKTGEKPKIYTATLVALKRGR